MAHDLVVAVSRAKPGPVDSGTQTSRKYIIFGFKSRKLSGNTLLIAWHQRICEDNALRHGQPVECVAPCWHGVVVPPGASD